MILDQENLAEEAMMFLSRFDWDSLHCTTGLLSGLVRKWLVEKPRHLCLLRFVDKAVYSADNNRLVVNVTPGSDSKVFADAHRPILYRCAVSELHVEPAGDDKILAPLELLDSLCALATDAFVNNLFVANLDFRNTATAYSFHDLLFPLRAVRCISLDKCELAKDQLNDEFLHTSARKHVKCVRAIGTAVYEEEPTHKNEKLRAVDRKQEALVQWNRSHVDVSPAVAVAFLSTTPNFWTSLNAVQLDGIHPALPMQLIRRFIKACEEGLVADVCYIDLAGDFASLPHEMDKWYGAFHTAGNSAGDGMGVTYVIPSLKIEVAVSYEYMFLARPTIAYVMSGAGLDSSKRF